MLTTDGFLLDGRLRFRQPAEGFRSGIEPVLLAASVPAKPGQRVLEAGTGAAAALLCLSARVPGVIGTGVEIDATLAALAAWNAAANGFDGISIQTGAIEAVELVGGFDHAIANPPYHAADGTRSASVRRETAKRGSAALLDAWVQRLAGALRPRGSLTLIVPAGVVPACLAAMAERDCCCCVLFPLWPKADRAAKLVLLRGVRGSRSPMRLAPGLVLHRPDGAFTDPAQAILRDNAPLTLGP